MARWARGSLRWGCGRVAAVLVATAVAAAVWLGTTGCATASYASTATDSGVSCPEQMDGHPLVADLSGSSHKQAGWEAIVCAYGPTPPRSYEVEFRIHAAWIPHTNPDAASWAGAFCRNRLDGDYYSETHMGYVSWQLYGLTNPGGLRAQQFLTDYVEPVAARCDTPAVPRGDAVTDAGDAVAAVPGVQRSVADGGDAAAEPAGGGGPSEEALLIAGGLILVLLSGGSALLGGPRAGDSADGSTEDRVDPDDEHAQEADDAEDGEPQEVMLDEQPHVTGEQLIALEDHFRRTVEERLAEGYVVRNRTFPIKVWNTLSDPLWWNGRSGQCGEFAEWGEEWTRSIVDEVFGPGAVVDTLVIEERSTVNPDGVIDWFDSWIRSNHAATRVILPDGQRFVVDYWEAMGRGRGQPPRIVSEAEWVSRWTAEIGGRFDGSVVDRPEAELTLRHFITQYGSEERGIEQFRRVMAREGSEELAETLIRSWARDPW